VAFDAAVIVAGAGPAGAVAARTLAAAGVDVLLADRAAFPRNKPCGGGISLRALRRFPWLDAALSDIDVHRIGRLHLESPDGSAVDLADPDPCVLLVRRVEFDHALVRAATAAGARLVERFEITQVEAGGDGVTFRARDGRRLSAPVVIAADGVHSVTAKRLGVNAKWPAASLAIDMMEETPVDTLRAERPDVLWVAYAYRGLDGYAYIFPKTHHVNVGIGCLLSHYKGEVPEHPYALQQGFVDALVRAGQLHGRSDRRTFTPFLIPVGGPLRPAFRGPVLFAGDAGGFVNAFTAEGIYYAMVSGELAGRAVARAGAAAGRQYERSWRREMGAELSDAVRIQRYLFGSHDRVNRAVRGAATMRGLMGMMLAYTRGDLPYASVRRRMLARFPLTVFRLARERTGARAGGAPAEE
jgi:geranylgeranyl reductase family protein